MNQQRQLIARRRALEERRDAATPGGPSAPTTDLSVCTLRSTVFDGGGGADGGARGVRGVFLNGRAIPSIRTRARPITDRLLEYARECSVYKYHRSSPNTRNGPTVNTKYETLGRSRTRFSGSESILRRRTRIRVTVIPLRVPFCARVANAIRRTSSALRFTTRSQCRHTGDALSIFSACSRVVTVETT